MSRSKSKATVASISKSFKVIDSRIVDPKTLSIAASESEPFFDPTHRHDLPFSPALLASIAEKGVIESIAATEVDGKLWVVDGRQRTRHAVAAGLRAVPVNVVEAIGYDATDAAMAVMELNRTAQGVADIDASRTAAAFIAAGKSRESVAQAMGVTASKLDALLLLAQAAPETKEAVAEGVISTSGAAIIARKAPELQKAIIEAAVEERAALNEQAIAEGRKPEAPTGTATNIDVRKKLAEATGKDLPESAKRATEKKADKAAPGPRAGGFNKEEIGLLKEKLEAAFVRCATDKEAALYMRGALAALSAVLTGDAGAHGDKSAAMREAVAAVRA